MVDKLSHNQIPWENAAEQSSRILGINNTVSLMSIADGIEASPTQDSELQHSSIVSDGKLGFSERALSAAGAAVLSAILVNPLDIAKVLFYFIFVHFSVAIDPQFIILFSYWFIFEFSHYFPLSYLLVSSIIDFLTLNALSCPIRSTTGVGNSNLHSLSLLLMKKYTIPLSDFCIFFAFHPSNMFSKL